MEVNILKKIFVLFVSIVFCLCLSSCKDEKTSIIEYDFLEGYEASNCTATFDNSNLDKVSIEKTFEINNYVNDAVNTVIPYQIFGNGMCLQRDCVNRIWGSAKGATKVAISFKDKVYYGNVDALGNWEVYLPMFSAGGPYEMIIITDIGRITLSDIYIGEVYLLCGQSNMEWKMSWSSGVLSEYYATTDCVNRQIRMLNLARNDSNEPTQILSDFCEWDFARVHSIQYFSAIGYLFGKQMQEELNCPIGLVATAVGGSVIEYWLNEESMKKVENEYNPIPSTDKLFTPSLGYNGLLYPLKGFHFRGCLWYQGASNTLGTQGKYDVALRIFIEQCRKEFESPNMTFTLIQLARLNENPLARSVINEKINIVAKEDPFVCRALSLDLGKWNDAHPQDKREISKRVTDETLKEFYGFDKKSCAEIESYKFNDDGTVTIILTKEVNLVNGSNGFEVYTSRGFITNCNVTVNGNVITISSEEKFSKVRYGYQCDLTDEIINDVSKMVTIYDNDGLPLDLFMIGK